ncbi:ATP-binding cassette domain-containing protein [Paracoccaceae bacterium]|nr:ATP-binding cassette domain-containing protein [Paracoccaceae bacterium]
MLELKGLKKVFGGITVLNDVDISFQRGNKIGLSGGNGTGKSTLLNIATGFLTAEEGAVILNGNNITHFEAWKLSRLGVKRTFQKVRFNEDLILKEQLYTSDKIIKKNLHILDGANVIDYLYSFPNEVPLPILRKIEVIRALLNRPKYLFLDEPSAGMAAADLHDFGEFLKNYIDAETCLVVVEHRLELMKKIDANICELRDGKLVNGNIFV